MTHTLTAKEQSLAKIFSDDYVFTIPGYQRPNSWGTEQAEELLGEHRAGSGKVWAGAVDAVKDVLKYDLEGAPSGTEARVRGWLDILTPIDTAQRLKLVVTEAPFDHAEEEGGNWIDVAARDAELLGRELGADWTSVPKLLGIVMQGEQRQAYAFGRGLAQGSGASHELYSAILDVMCTIPFERRNSALLSGWLAEIDDHDGQACDRLFSEVAGHGLLRESLPSIARGLRLNDLRIENLKVLLESGHIAASQLYGLSSGQAMSGVSIGCVSALSRTLVSGGTDGAWVALDILFMYSYGNASLVESLQSEFQDVVLTRGMLSSERAIRDSHEYEVAAVRVVKQSAGAARQLTEELCAAIGTKSGSGGHLTEKLLGALIEHQAQTVWPILRAALAGPDRLAKWKLSDALGAPARLGDQAGPIDKLDPQLLREWCTDEPAVAPPLVARLVAVIEKDEGGLWKLSKTAQMLIDEFGDSGELLNALGASLHTFSWSGSLVPFYERLISVVSPLLAHQRESVREWARRMVDGAKETRNKEAQRDEEQRLGRW